MLVLRGSPTEAASAVLRGTLVLCLAEPFNIKKIMLRLQGTSRIGYAGLVGCAGRGVQPLTCEI